MSPICSKRWLCLSPVAGCVPARRYVVTLGSRSIPSGGWLRAEGPHDVFAHPIGDKSWDDVPGLIAMWVEDQATRPDRTPVFKAIDVKEASKTPCDIASKG